MPMDERTKRTVRALLHDYPRGYVAEEAGFTVTRTAAGLFRLLLLSLLAEDSAPSGAAIEATNAMLSRRWDSAPEMAKVSGEERSEVLRDVGYPRLEATARAIGDATAVVLERYHGDLENLREAAGGDGARLRQLLGEIPGMSDAGCAVFIREAQAFWPEAGPFLDSHAIRAAGRLGLPTDPERLLRDVARGQGEEMLSWLSGALTLTDTRDTYDAIESATGT